MQYISTRGQCPAVDFETAVMNGLAPDGGLYVPARFPTLPQGTLAGLRGKPFAEVAWHVLRPFVQPSLDDDELRGICDRAWRHFDHPNVAPMRRIGERWLLELFHGPTLAFKDVALQLLGLLFDHFLARQGRRATVLGATSGDTGSAAIAGCRGRDQLQIVILHPYKRTSAVQRRQMTTVADANVHNLAVRGTFDDCQAIVKALFREPDTRTRHGLSAVNSINTARVLAQIVYYVAAAAELGGPLSFCVPTGNFGDILAGHWARRMGVPIRTLIVATNTNDILARVLHDGEYRVDGVVPTLSPSMDIQVSSNFERLLFELADNDGATVREQMRALQQDGGFRLSDEAVAKLRAGFAAGSADDAMTIARIRKTAREFGVVVDPHGAVAVDVADAFPTEPPMVVLATAHPAKFPAAVKEATGEHPALPPHLSDLMQRPERYEVVDNSVDAVRDVLEQVLNA